MKPHGIDDQIREYYQGQRLSEEARARLKAVLNDCAAARESSRWRWIKTGIVAAFVIAVTAAILLLAVFRGYGPESPPKLAAAVAQHAATGHNERQELEFRVSRTSELRQAMKSLDFTPVEPAMFTGMKMRIVGARYTTVEGVMAAQILYVDPKGERCTLFELRPVAPLARVPNGEHDVDGLRVSVWREKGLLMMLARPVA
jgi:hypothetical protein